VQLLASRAAANAGHAELAGVVLRALKSRDSSVAARELIGLRDESFAAEVPRQWGAASDTAREQQAWWPALQQLLIGISSAHQQLRTAAAGTATPKVDAAVQTAVSGLGEAGNGSTTGMVALQAVSGADVPGIGTTTTY
jgi:hypothetical protein